MSKKTGKSIKPHITTSKSEKKKMTVTLSMPVHTRKAELIAKLEYYGLGRVNWSQLIEERVVEALDEIEEMIEGEAEQEPAPESPAQA